MPQVSTRRPALRHGTLTAPHAAGVPTIPTRHLRARQPRPRIGGSPTVIPLPDLLVQRRGGVTFIDTASGDVDCNLGDIVANANVAITTSLTVAVSRVDLLASLLDDDLEPRLDAVIEVTIGATLLPRFVITGVRLADDQSSVIFDLADRRYELAARFVGRTGFPPNLTPTFFGTGTPSGWTVVDNGTDTPTITPYVGAGVFGPTDSGAMTLFSDGTGPDWVETTFTPAAVPYDRKVAFGSFFMLPAGGWHPNAATLLMSISTVDDATDEDIDQGTVDLNNETDYTPGAWFASSVAASIPADVVARVQVRIYFQAGTIYVEDANTYQQESLFWVNGDTGQILRDLVAHANDTANWGHSDTNVRSTPTSVPDTGVLVTRTIDSQEKQQVSAALSDICTIGSVWQWLEPQDDGTDLFHADEANEVANSVAEDGNAKVQPWTWAGSQAAGVLGMFAPDTVDFTGQRLIVWAGKDGLLRGRGLPYDLGREAYTVGPYGSYDARLLQETVEPFYKAKEAALTSSVTFGFDPTVVDEAAGGNLRAGNFMDARVGVWPRSLTGRYRISAVTIHPKEWQVTVELNRETVGA